VKNGYRHRESSLFVAVSFCGRFAQNSLKIKLKISFLKSFLADRPYNF